MGYLFATGFPPGQLGSELRPTLFQSENYLRHHAGHDGLICFRVDQVKPRGTCLYWAFTRCHDAWLSPYRAPYAGPVIHRDPDLETWIDFLLFIEEEARQQRVSSIEFSLCPVNQSDHHKFGQFLTAVSTQEYDAAERAVAHTLFVDSVPLANKLSEGEKGRLKKAQAMGFVFQKEPVKELPQIYDFLLWAKQQKSYRLSMGKSALLKLSEQFPDHYHFFSVFHNQVRIASCIAVQVHERKLFTYTYDHHPDYNAFSPVVFLLSGLYDWAGHSNIAAIDLGTSMTGNEENIGLSRFKERMGAQASEKIRYRLCL